MGQRKSGRQCWFINQIDEVLFRSQTGVWTRVITIIGKCTQEKKVGIITECALPYLYCLVLLQNYIKKVSEIGSLFKTDNYKLYR
jgi:hypothetical protein